MKKTVKIFLSVLLVLCMLMPMCTFVFATGDTETQKNTAKPVSVYEGDWKSYETAITNFANGTATSYDITEAGELVALSQVSQTKNFAGKSFYLKTNVIFNEGDASTWASSRPTYDWQPIGSSSKPFCANFYGEGHTISGVYINTTSDWIAPFARIGNGADITDLGIINSYIKTTKSYAAGIVARIGKDSKDPSNTTTISGCYVDAIISGGSYTKGGIVALLTEDGVNINGCVFAGEMVGTASNGIGGIVGCLQYENSLYSSAAISNCLNMGTFSEDLITNVGAMVGSSTELTIERCLNYGASNYLVGKVQYDSAKYNRDTSLKISDCYTFGAEAVGDKTLLKTNNGISINKDTYANMKAIHGILPTTYSGTWTLSEKGYPIPKAAYDSFKRLFDVDDPFNYVADDPEIILGYDNEYFFDKISETTEYNIDSEYEFAYIVKLMNSGYFPNNSIGYTFKLTRDMVFNEGGDAKTWASSAPSFKWTPIGTKNGNYYEFQGTFDGQGHTVSGIYVDDMGVNYQGFFGYLNQYATVKNVGIVNSYFKQTGAYGNGFIGRINKEDVTVSGIYSEAIIDSSVSSSTGGIIGLVSNTGGTSDKYTIIENCVFNGTINEAKGTAGGIVGHAAQYQYNHLVVRDCMNLGTVNAQTYAGGIVGQGSKVTLERCMNVGTVNSTNYHSGAIIGTVAANHNGTDPTKPVKDLKVIDCFNTTRLVLSSTSSDVSDQTVTVISDVYKGKNPFTSSDGAWIARSNYIGDEYPLPASIYLNFFKVDLKYVQSSDVKDGTYAVRIISEIDSLNYHRAGFKVKVTLTDGTSKSLDTTNIKVYKTVTSGTRGYQEVTARDGKYFVALTLTDMPTNAKTYEFTPYTLGDNGEYAYGATKILTFDSKGVCVDVQDKYAVVYDSSDPENAISAMKIAAAFGNVTGTTVDIVGDDDVAANDSAHELLLGNTNRTQTTAAKNALSGQRYSITKNGNKTVIVAANDMILEDAIKYFIDNIKSVDGTCQYPTSYTSDVYQTLDLVTSGMANYKIVYTDFYNNLNKHSDTIWNDTDIGFTQTRANAFVNELNTITNTTFECISEASMSSAKEIVIGKPKGDTINYFNYYENGVYLKDGDIYIYGHTQEGIVDAIDNFLARVKEYNKEVDSTKYSILCEANGYKWKNANMKYSIPLPSNLEYEGAYTAANNGVYFVYENCKQENFVAYCNELAAAGFTQYFSRSVDNNQFAGFYKGGEAAWIYYIGDRSELRIVFEDYQPDPAADIASDGECKYEPYVVQMGVSHTAGNANEGKGMGYIIGLEDGRYIIIDGNIANTDNGSGLTTADRANLAARYYNFLNENNQRSDGIVIAAWIITHGHSDHYDNFEYFAKTYGSQVKCQSIIHNLPNELTLEGAGNNANYFLRNHKGIEALFSGVKVYTVHTGYEIMIGGVHLEFMSTYEDLYNNNALVKYSTDPCQPNAVDQFNDTCLTFRFTFKKGESDQATVFFLGDNYYDHGERLASMWSADYLKSDVVQAAHHGHNNGVANGQLISKGAVSGDLASTLYSEIRAKHVFWTRNYSSVSGAVYDMLNGYNSSCKWYDGYLSFMAKYNTIYTNDDSSGNALNSKMTFNGGIKVTQTVVS